MKIEVKKNLRWVSGRGRLPRPVVTDLNLRTQRSEDNKDIRECSFMVFGVRFVRTNRQSKYLKHPKVRSPRVNGRRTKSGRGQCPFGVDQFTSYPR